MPTFLDLVGPEGYVHGWIKVGPGKPFGNDTMTKQHAGHSLMVHATQPSKATSSWVARVDGRRVDLRATRADAMKSAHKSAERGGKPADWIAQQARTRAELPGTQRGIEQRTRTAMGMANGYDFAAPKLGGGGRFRKLSATLAARGASNPDALAAWIGRRKYGAAKMGRLSHHSHAMPGLGGILLSDSETGLLRCPNCGYKSDAAKFAMGAGSASDTSVPDAPDALRTPDGGNVASTGFSPESAGINVRSGAGGAGLSNTMNFSAGTATRRLPVTKADDIVVGRGKDGRAVVRHRVGGTEIGTLRREGTGWIAALDGSGDLQSRTQQRAALMDLLGTWNRSTVTPARPAMPLQQPPAQTPLMNKFGVENIRAFATPAVSAGAGPRVTLAANGDAPNDIDGDGDNDLAGLTPKGRTIYAKLRKKGFPADRALQFARRAQNFGGNKSSS